MTTPDCAATGSDCKPLQPNWLNWARNQPVYARCVARPRTLEELQEIVRDVSSRGRRLRAVATGLSFSDILQTDDTLVVLTDLLAPHTNGPLLPLEEELWHDPTPLEPRVRVVAGARIRELNAALAQAGLGFENLGGYDGQTFVGAVSTSTHGSGVHLGPLPNAVRSLDLVTTDGVLYRIEPAAAPMTDPAKFTQRYGNSMQLVQSDTWFQAAVVSLGCLGVIYSMTVAVRSAYRLHEHRNIACWSDVRKELRSLRGPLAARNYEVLINPYPRRDGDRTCVVTRRNIARPNLDPIPLPSERLAQEDFVFRESTQRGVLRLMQSTPRLVPTILENGLEALKTGRRGHLEDSYRIYNIGKINTAEVLSGEYFVPVANDVFLGAVDRILQVVADNQKHHVYQTAPISLRFVDRADAFLSMAHGERMCAIEIAAFTESYGAREALLSYEQALYQYGGRPHWGQLHELTGAKGFLQRAYPCAKAWLDVYRQLNHKHVFDNAFTDRMRLSSL